MPRYFFHTQDGQRFHDDEGSELSDLTAAREEALKLLGGILPALQVGDGPAGAMWLTVSDEAERPLIRIRVEVEPVGAEPKV